MLQTLLLLQLAVAAPADSLRALQVSATRYEFATTSAMQGPEGTPANATARLRATLSGSMLRYEVLSTPALLKMDGMDSTITLPLNNAYTLLLDNRMYVVDTLKHEYFETDMKALESGLSDAMIGLETVNFRVSDTKFDVQEMGPGDRVMNHPTTRWHATGSFTIQMAAGPDSAGITLEEVSDYYYATDFSMPPMRMLQPDSAAVAGPFAAMLGEDYAKMLLAGFAKLPKATPVKTVTRMSMLMGMIDMVTTNTNELVSVETLQLPASWFAIPKDFKRVEMPMPGIPKPGSAQNQ